MTLKSYQFQNAIVFEVGLTLIRNIKNHIGGTNVLQEWLYIRAANSISSKARVTARRAARRFRLKVPSEIYK